MPLETGLKGAHVLITGKYLDQSPLNSCMMRNCYSLHASSVYFLLNYVW